MAVPLLVAKLAETCRLRLPRRLTLMMAGPPPSVTEYTERSRLISLVAPKIVSVVVPTAPMVAVPEATLRPKIAVTSGSPLLASRVVIVNDAVVSFGPNVTTPAVGSEVLAGHGGPAGGRPVDGRAGRPARRCATSVISLSWPYTAENVGAVNWTTDAGGAASWICSVVVDCAPSVAAASGMLSVIGTVSVPSRKLSLSRVMVKLAV